MWLAFIGDFNGLDFYHRSLHGYFGMAIQRKARCLYRHSILDRRGIFDDDYRLGRPSISGQRGDSDDGSVVPLGLVRPFPVPSNFSEDVVDAAIFSTQHELEPIIEWAILEHEQ